MWEKQGKLYIQGAVEEMLDQGELFKAQEKDSKYKNSKRDK